MLLSFGIMFLFGLIFSSVADFLRIPKLVGYIVSGIILGPVGFNIIDPTVISISSDIKTIALIVILLRAGLTLDIGELMKIGRPAVLMCFVPAVFEILAVTVLAPLLFKISYVDAAMMGAVLAAVSPAIIVPRMIKIKEEGLGNNKSIPQIILAGASADDIFVIIVFTALLQVSTQKGEFNLLNTVLSLPISIILGILVGAIVGVGLAKLFKTFKTRDTVKILVLISVSFILVGLEAVIKNIIPFSSLLGVITMGILILKLNFELASRLSIRFNKVWIGAEILLFTLVGIGLKLDYVLEFGFLPVVLIMFCLFIRCIGVFICLLGTDLSFKEKLFCIFSYIPKATVQAAIGSIPLSMGLASGELILTVAVISILITAPLGAILIDNSYKKLLKT